MTDRSEAVDGTDRNDHVRARRWNLGAVAIASLTGLGAALLPLVATRSIEAGGVETSGQESLLSSEGPGVLVVVAIPIVLVALPLMFRSAKAAHRSRVTVAVVLGVLVILGAASIGLLFVPTLIAMIGSVVVRKRKKRPTPTSPPEPPPPAQG